MIKHKQLSKEGKEFLELLNKNHIPVQYKPVKCYEVLVYICQNGEECWNEVYAETASKARYKAYTHSDAGDEFSEWIKFPVRRKKQNDIFPHEPDKELMKLSSKSIELMAHAIGFTHRGASKHIWRNHYVPRVDGEDYKNWKELEKTGWAREAENFNMPYFYVTENGLNAFKTLIKRV